MATVCFCHYSSNINKSLALGRVSDKHKEDEDYVTDDTEPHENGTNEPSVSHQPSIDKSHKIQLLSSLCDTHEKMNDYYQQEKHDRV
jgi:glycine cleavage system aminomethyltransferase T